jgi:hypothetical protein
VRLGSFWSSLGGSKMMINMINRSVVIFVKKKSAYRAKYIWYPEHKYHGSHFGHVEQSNRSGRPDHRAMMSGSCVSWIGCQSSPYPVGDDGSVWVTLCSNISGGYHQSGSRKH